MIEQNPIYLSDINRKSVRAMVESETAIRKQAMADGKNVHQVSLDRQDLVQAYMATLSAGDLEKFITLYEQEMSAATQTILDETASTSAAVATSSANVATWISLIIFFAFVMFMIRLLR